jgi:two-component system invasion response regulator UvrY
MIRVLVVDDHKLVRNGLRMILESAEDIEVIGECESGEEALEQAPKMNPDVVLIDIMMPGMGGVDASKNLRKKLPKTEIVVVSAMSQDAFSFSLQEVGVRGFVSKSSNEDEMIEAVRQVMQGKIYMSRDVAQQLALTKTSGDKAASLADLSERELQVLLMVVKGMRVNDISEKLFLSPKTVSTYRQRMMDKLGVNNDVELTYWALRHQIVELQ